MAKKKQQKSKTYLVHFKYLDKDGHVQYSSEYVKIIEGTKHDHDKAKASCVKLYGKLNNFNITKIVCCKF